MTQSLYQDHFGIRENPFSIIPDPHYLYMSPRHQDALAHLLYGVSESGGFVLLTGEVGTGKTTICRALIEQLPETVDLAMILNPRLSEIELMAAICDELGIAYPRGTDSLKDFFDFLNRRLLTAHAQGRNPVLMIDEAQNLSSEGLELVRLLTNLETKEKKLLQIILVGQPELNHILADPKHRQTAQRITARFHLEPLGLMETRNYILHRLHVAGLDASVFSAGAVKAVHKAARGIPRLINSVCDRALLAAYVEGRKQVTPKLARAAAAEVMGSQTLTSGRSVWGSLALVLVFLGLLLWVAYDPYRTGIKETLGTLIEPLLPPPAETTASPPVKTAVAPSPAMPEQKPEPAPEPEPAAPEAESATPASEESAQEQPAPEPDAEPDGVPTGEPMTEPTTEPMEAAAALDQMAAEPAPQGDEAEAAQPEPEQPESPQQVTAMRNGEDVTRTEGTVLADFISSGTPDRAFENLFALWGQSYFKLKGLTPCDKAVAAGVECLRGETDLAGLKAMNRPAVASFVMPDGEHVYGVIKAIDEDGITISFQDRELTLSNAAFNLRWPGDFLVLWKRPAGIERALVFGQQGEDVRELRRLLALAGFADGPKDIDGQGSVFFGPSLREQIRAFQETHGLRVDGIAGPETLLRVSGVARDTAAPLMLSGKE